MRIICKCGNSMNTKKYLKQETGSKITIEPMPDEWASKEYGDESVSEIWFKCEKCGNYERMEI